MAPPQIAAFAARRHGERRVLCQLDAHGISDAVMPWARGNSGGDALYTRGRLHVQRGQCWKLQTAGAVLNWRLACERVLLYRLPGQSMYNQHTE